MKTIITIRVEWNWNGNPHGQNENRDIVRLLVSKDRFIHETTSDFQAAVGRIERLKDATEAELRHHNDVCAICYADMQVSSFSFSFLSAIHHNFDNFLLGVLQSAKDCHKYELREPMEVF